MRLAIATLLLPLLAAASPGSAEEPKAEVVVDGLNNPCGVAIQPETGHLFVADSGAGRVVRVVDGKMEDVITGFAKDVYGKGPMFDIGPLGLLFLDKDTLVVGGGDLPDGEEQLRVFKVPAAGAEAIQVEAAAASFGLPGDDDQGLKGEGNFYALVATENGVYVTCNGDDNKGWISRAARKGNELSDYKRFLATKELVHVDAPVGITLSPRGELVVGQMGEINVPNDSLLSFYDEEGKLLLNLETGLHDIAALAYSPKGYLYALDFAWLDTEQGGLFRLDAAREDGKQAVKATKIMGLDKPTAMTFGTDGALYLTVIGSAEEGGAAPGGKLLRIAPGL